MNDNEYDLHKPFVIDVKYRDSRLNEEYKYEPLFDATDEENHHSIEFQLRRLSGRREIEIQPCPLSFTELFFPDNLIDEWVDCTNKYARNRLPVSRVLDVTRSDIL